MKRKLTILMFGLLLAVGWTSNAFAQSYTLKASEMKTDGVYWTYEWVDANGVTQTSTYINPTTNVADSVTDPYQIYGLLRAVYMDKRLPGPYYSAYMKNGITREDPVFYGGMAGGWDIPYTGGSTTTTYSDIVIHTGMTNTRDDQTHARIVSIQIIADGTTISTVNANNIASLPDGWTKSGTWTASSGYFYSSSTSTTLTFDGDLLQGKSTVQVVVRAYHYNYYNDYGYARVYVNDDYNSNLSSSEENYTWTINSNNSSTTVDENLYKPDHEGYTALVVSLYNDTTKIYPEPTAYWGSWEFTATSTQTAKQRLIEYITNNISHVKLLTDGVRIGEGYDVGTVFNASGTYNRFFFLGKGQARKKAESVETRISSNTWPSYCGEQGPFKFMYEEFSPTTGATYSDITDFYIEMMDGKVYPVVHDCASVIQNKHQFSMAGKKGTEYKALSGLNFFIPDYRLLWWDGTGNDPGYPTTAIDGRDMDPYQRVNSDGSHGSAYRTVSNQDYYYFSAYYAQYNQDHAPLVGIYLITLDAEAEPAAAPRTYTVNLDWTSSLNDMSGSTVPQTYTVYVVNTDENGVETLDTLVVTGQTHYDYTVPQNEHSYTITYIVQGTPADSEHPEFVAWSNQDAVVIPGWNDFLSLALEHYESDFDVPKVRNWYRNFLAVDNENADNALTTTRIAGGENNYTLLRYDYNNPNVKEEVATLSFEVKNGGKTVDYTAALTKQAVEESKYLWSALGFTMTSETMTAGTTKGTLSVKGNGDIVIQPSGYDVNFYSITVTSGNQTVTSWNANQTLASRGWEVTNGSKFIKDTGTNYYYLEGGGYIRIPYTVLGNYTNVRVVINASRDASKTAWISVNEDKQTMTTAAATNYTWNSVNTTSNAKLNAPNRAPVNTDVTFTAGTDAAQASTITKNGVTITNTQTTGNNSFSYNPYRIYAGTLAISTTTGTITKIVFNGTSTNNPVDRLSTTTGNYSVSNNVGTWTGEATSVNFSASGQARCSSIVVTVTTEEDEDEPITKWVYSEQGATMTTGWTLTPGSTTGASGLGNGDTGSAIWINTPGYITIPASFFTNYENIRVVITYNSEDGRSVSLDVNGDTHSAITSTSSVTQTWTNVDATNGIVITPSTGYLNISSIKVYGDPTTAPPTPVTEGMVRLGNLPIVDQFYANIPATNNHPSRYAYVLKYVGADTTIYSTVAEVPVQKTGAEVEGYYTINEMLGDTIPADFLTEDMLSAEVDMNLSPSSAPYFYTINSKLNGVPATAWNNYVNVLQRRSDGTYQEMLTKGGGVDNPYYGNIYPAGPFDQVDYRNIQAAAKTDSLSYVPIVWTMGIDRRYFADDSIHNSYGAPVWEVRVGDIEVGGAHVERQAANALGDWNPAVNWYDENGNACSLFIVDNLQATGVLPVCNVEYEPYMFRVWVVGDGLRGYQWVDAGVDPNLPGRHVVNDPDAPRTSPQLIYTKMCSGPDDLTLAITKSSDNDYANCVMFGGVNSIKPTFLIRFYYKVKGTSGNLLRGTREGEDEDHVGYVVKAPADPGDPSTYVYEIIPTGEVVSKIYYNTQGMMSDQPFDGVNIVVTRYSDGTTTTSKVIR